MKGSSLNGGIPEEKGKQEIAMMENRVPRGPGKGAVPGRRKALF